MKIFAALEHANEARRCMARCTVHQLPGLPVEIRFGEVYIGQRVAVMRVETSRNDNEVGSKAF